MSRVLHQVHQICSGKEIQFVDERAPGMVMQGLPMWLGPKGPAFGFSEGREMLHGKRGKLAVRIGLECFE